MTATRQSPKPTRTLSKTRLRLWLKLLKVARAIEAEVRERLRVEFDTTLPRFDVMAALDRHFDGLKMSELSGVLKVSNGNVTGIIDRLVSDGLVERIPVKDDRRAMVVRLTTRGGAHFAVLAARHEQWVNELLGDFGTDDAQVLHALLVRIAPPRDEMSEAAE